VSKMRQKFDETSGGGGGGGDEARPQPAAGSGDATVELFERAVRQHSRRLLAIARAIVGTRASPGDVVQQAVMNLYQHRQRYDWREPGGLLKRAVVNEALRLLRHPRMSVVADDHPAEHGPGSAVVGMIDDETVVQVRAAIARLPDHFRAALVLCEYEQLSYVEIAQALGASVPQVKTWLHRARRQLAGMLEGYVKGKQR
jgi:RNA polymerase sigma-70 factor (ECF subfamily)